MIGTTIPHFSQNRVSRNSVPTKSFNFDTVFSAAQCTVHSLAGSLARTRVVGLRLRRYSPLISCPIFLFLLWYIIKVRKIQNICLVPYFMFLLLYIIKVIKIQNIYLVSYLCFWYDRKKIRKIQNIYLVRYFCFCYEKKKKVKKLQ